MLAAHNRILVLKFKMKTNRLFTSGLYFQFKPSKCNLLPLMRTEYKKISETETRPLAQKLKNWFLYSVFPWTLKERSFESRKSQRSINKIFLFNAALISSSFLK